MSGDRKRPLWRRVLQKVLATFLAVAMVAIFYLAVVLGQPQQSEDAVAVDMTQPLLTASPARSLTDGAALSDLIADYPAPVLSFLEGAGPELVSGTSYDTAFEGGFARVVDLRYRTAEGAEIRVETIYPARALSLLGRGDYALTSGTAQSLSGLRAIRMEDAENIRLHAQSADALYVLTAPRLEDDALSALLKSLQLYTARKEGS